MQVSKIAQSCNGQMVKNEIVYLKPKQSKLKKNRMQAKNEAIQNYTVNLADIGLKKQRRKEIAQNRRANSK